MASINAYRGVRSEWAYDAGIVPRPREPGHRASSGGDYYPMLSFIEIVTAIGNVRNLIFIEELCRIRESVCSICERAGGDACEKCEISGPLLHREWSKSLM